MATALRFCRGMYYNYNQTGRASEFLKPLYEFWGYCLNGTSALQTPGGFANTMTLSYSVSNTTGAGVSPIVVTTTTTNALFTGQQVNISGVLGNFAANGIYQITVLTGSTFSLNNTTGNGGYTGGGLVNTTPFGWHTNFTEGTPVLAVGNDGYTAAQISLTTTGDATFTALNSSPFTATATSITVSTATNFQTTIAAGSNGVSLPTGTINVASTTPVTTTITASSNNVSLPTATINVVTTTGFPSAGNIMVTTTEGIYQVTYTGITTTTFTGCTGGIGPMFTGGSVFIQFPTSGNLNVTTSDGVQLVTYTAITGTSFTGCTGGTGTMSTGNAVSAPIQLTSATPNAYNDLQSVTVNGVLGNTAANGITTGGNRVINIPTYTINTANFFNTVIAFPSNGQTLPQATVNAITVAPVTTTSGVQTLPTGTINVRATAAASTTLLAASNGVSLPAATINATSTAGFPTSGSISVFATPSTTITVPSNLQTLPQATIFVSSTSGFATFGNSGTIAVATSAATTTIAAASNGAILPQGTINVASTTGFPVSGTLFVTTSFGAQVVTYSGGGGGGTTFTGCTGGIGTMSTGGAVVTADLVTFTGTNGISFTGCTGGTGTMLTGGAVAQTVPVAQTVTYTGITATTFTGCLGGVGLMATGNGVNNSAFFNAFPAAGTLYIVTTTGAQPVSYTGITATSFTGCTNGTGNTSDGGSVFTSPAPATSYTSITAASDGASLPQATINVTATTTASTTIAAGSNGAILPQATINVATTTGFPNSGTLNVTTSAGVQTVYYTGTSGGNQFTGCTGGVGTMSTGGAVNNTGFFASFPTSGYVYVRTSTGFMVVTYTGKTATTFTGCTGGAGTMNTGNAVFETFTNTGTVNVVSTTGTQTLTYTGTTATSFTGVTGGTGVVATGNSVFSPAHVTTNLGTTITTGQTVIIAGLVGMNGVNGTNTITRISNRNFAVNTSVPSGTYVSDGSVFDRTNLLLRGSVPNGTWTSGGTQTIATTNMVGKLLVIWKPNSGTTEDSMYLISSVISPNSVKVNLNTGGTPDPVTLHPSFTERSNINYRVVEGGIAQTFSSGNGNFMVMQFNPSAIGINPGQANSQVQMFGNDSTGNIGMIMSPGGNWNGVTFPVTGNVQIDATTQFNNITGIFNGGPLNNMAIHIAADPGFFMMHFKDVNSGDGSSYMHAEIPTRLYPQDKDTNPVVGFLRGGVFSGTVFSTAVYNQAWGNGFGMKCADGVYRQYRALSKSLFGDGTPCFGTGLTDVRIAFNTLRGSVLSSDCILALPGVTNQFALARVKLRTIKFTSTPLPTYHRFGTANGVHFINIANGCAIIWDNTIIPKELLFII